MTGSGTQADPYVFENVADFLNAINITEAYVEAKKSNMQFNCNTDEITLPIDFKCRSFDGKGLTILNPVVQNTNTAIVLVHGYERAAYSAPEPQVLKNLNIYNYVFQMAGATTCLLSDDFSNNNGYKRCRFENCNFAGSISGYPNDLRSSGIGTAFIGHNSDSYYGNWLKYELVNCTLNIHFNDATNHDVYFWLSHGTRSGYYGQSYLYLEGTTISMSGSSNLKIQFGNTVGKGATIESPLDSIDSKLQCQSFNESLISKGDSGNNEHRMFVETTGDITISDSIGLILSNRYDAGGAATFSGIVMQETDPTAQNYAYNEQNLNTAGFPIGRVIH